MTGGTEDGAAGAVGASAGAGRLARRPRPDPGTGPPGRRAGGHTAARGRPHGCGARGPARPAPAPGRARAADVPAVPQRARLTTVTPLPIPPPPRTAPGPAGHDPTAGTPHPRRRTHMITRPAASVVEGAAR